MVSVISKINNGRLMNDKVVPMVRWGVVSVHDDVKAVKYHINQINISNDHKNGKN